MTLRKTSAAVFVALMAVGVGAQAAAVSQLTITGGTFTMFDTSGGVAGSAPITPGPAQPIVAGSYQGSAVPTDSLTSFLVLCFAGIDVHQFGERTCTDG